MALALRAEGVLQRLRLEATRTGRTTPNRSAPNRALTRSIAYSRLHRPFADNMRKYCTFRIEKFEEAPKLNVEVEEAVEEVAEDEIPLVESHWDVYEKELSNRLKERLEATHVQIWDRTRPNCGIVLEIHVESPMFASPSKADHHRLVTSALKGLIDDVHAITIKTKAST